MAIKRLQHVAFSMSLWAVSAVDFLEFMACDIMQEMDYWFKKSIHL